MTVATAPDPTGGLAGWWGRSGPVTRVVTVVVVVVLGVNVFASALGSVLGGDPGGPDGSSLATGGDGVAAWSDLLGARGVEVVALREPLGEATLPVDGTVVIVDPDVGPTEESIAALVAHVSAGGRVVAVGPDGSAWAEALLGQPLGWTGGGGDGPAPTPGGLLDGLGRLAGEGRGRYSTPGATTVEAGPGGRPVIVSAADGAVVAVADPSLLGNRLLAEGDNAALAVILAGPGPVAFAEAEHGFGAAQGLGALPFRWRLSGAALALATLVGFWAYGQRLGPPDVTDRSLPPPRHAYVDAVGAALTRASSPGRGPGPPPVPQEDS